MPSEVRCPKCGSGEMHPRGDKLLIRAYKVFSRGRWWSQCLVCSGYYDSSLNETPDNHDGKRGWF